MAISVYTTLIPAAGVFFTARSAVTEQSHNAIHIHCEVDTIKIAVLPFIPEMNFPFDSSHKAATLTPMEFKTIESLLITCVNKYNYSLYKKDRQWMSIDLEKTNYGRQIIAVINQKGEKEVWVNCFCTTPGDERWKSDILFVADGGNCYFNFKINLRTKRYYNLIVNGEA